MPTPRVLILGSYVQDHCWRTETFPGTGESRIGTFSTGPGGKGFNQAVACHRQGVATRFLGAVGADALADTARRYAAEVGLDARFEVRPEVATAASSILVDARGDNRIVVALGANDALSAAFVDSESAAIAAAEVVVLQLENALDATRRAIGIARAAARTILLNPAPINPGVDAWMLAEADILTPNETEFAFLMQHVYGQPLAERYWELPDPMLHALARRCGSPTVVITLGDKGAFVSHANAARRNDTAPYYRVPAEAVRAIDTTGAGDAFTGGLAAGLVIHGPHAPFRDAVLHANRVAAMSTERPGTAPAMPTRAEITARFG
jgi:ribokinase